MVEQFPVSDRLRARSRQPGKVRFPFYSRGPSANRRQPGLSHPGQRDMPMPTMPVTDLVLIQAGFVFGRFETLFNGGSGGRHLSQSFQGHFQGRVGQEVGDVGRSSAGTNVGPARP